MAKRRVTVKRSTCATSRGRGLTHRQPSPTMSDSSELSVLSRTPSPPPAPRDRKASPALSYSSELSVLSRTPSPPPECMSDSSPSDYSPSEYSPTPKRLERGPNGRFLPKSAKRTASPSPVPRSAKRLRLRVVPDRPSEVSTPKKALASPASPCAPRKTRYAPSSRSSAQKKKITASPAIIKVQSGSGDLDRLPKEIRQLIYSYCLDAEDPVLLKQCCGPNSTRRERASCRKHGDGCMKIGKGNGLTLYDEDLEGSSKTYGRFNVLSLSRAINEEASWLLYTRGSVLIESTTALQAYLSDTQCTFYRLPSHATEHAKRMWLSVARFRNVCFELPWWKGSIDDPVECVYRLYEASAFLMKAWSMLPEKPTLSPVVTVQLNALYTSIIPFNADSSFKMAYEWTAYWQPHLASNYLADFELIGETTGEIVERLLDLVGRHGGSSQWNLIAEAPDQQDDQDDGSAAQADGENGGVAPLRSLEKCCALNGVAFATTA